MIQVFKSVKTQPPSQAQGALPAGPVWQGRDSLAPHRYVGLHGAASRARVPSALSQLIPISSELTWPNPGTSRMGSGCSPGPGSVWQALAPSHLLLPTPRTHFPSLAALGPLHPQPCWWVMEHPHCRSLMSPYYGAVSPLCHTEPILLGEMPRPWHSAP